MFSPWWVPIDAFPYYCPGARRGNVFVATWLLRPRPRTSIVLNASSPVTKSRVLARFSVNVCLRSLIFSDAEKTKILCHDRCSVSHWPIEKKKKKKKRFVPRPCFFPASSDPELGSWLPRSHFRQHRRLQWSSYPLIIHSGVLSTERPGSFMAVILAGERAIWGKKPRLRGCSVFAIKRKQVVCAPPD